MQANTLDMPIYLIVSSKDFDVAYTKNRIINILDDHFGAMPVAAFRSEMELFNPSDVLAALDEIESEGKLGYFQTTTKAAWVYLKKPEESPKGEFKVSIETWDSKGDYQQVFEYKDYAGDDFIHNIDKSGIEYLLMRIYYDFRNAVLGITRGKRVLPNMKYN